MNGTIVNGSVASCCQDLSHRRVVTQSTGDDGADRRIEQCAICERKHYILTVPQTEFGVSGASLG